MKLWLIRHGQTPSNVLGLLDTAVPGPGLTDLGVEQAAAIPGALRDQALTAVFASSQTRAQLTAAPLAGDRGLTVQVRPGLREISAGQWEMGGDKDAVQGYLGAIGRWFAGDLEHRLPGGETGRDVLDRYDAVIDEVVAAGGDAAVISHGAIIRLWATVRSSNLPRGFGAGNVVHNTGIVELESDGTGWRTLTWAGTAIGGLELDDPGTDGPGGDAFEMRSALPQR
jgi:broad specificity phosphatase PhoE